MPASAEQGLSRSKLALEQLLGGRCHHLSEVFGRLDHISVWLAAAAGQNPDWGVLLADYQAAVDWPAAAFWRELSDANPDALVLLSVRNVDSWWTSVSNTIIPAIERSRERLGFPPGWPEDLLAAKFTPDRNREVQGKAAYLHHNEEVRRTINPDRLLEWQPGDGAAPICAALDIPEPLEPFPARQHHNTSEGASRHLNPSESKTGRNSIETREVLLGCS